MAGVTDMAFRTICKSYGADLVYTEMVSAKALKFKNRKTRRLLEIGDQEKPVGVQIFGNEPVTMAIIAKEVCDIYGDSIKVIDINMGCPAPKIVNNGEGCALMQSPTLVGKIVKAVRKEIDIPLTVKFRKGMDDAHVNAVDIAKISEQNGADAVTVHGRTRNQYYSGRVDLDIIAQVKQAVAIPVIGNGDIFCGRDAKQMYKITGVDAIMVARGAMGNPFIFRDIKTYLASGESAVMPSAQERARVLLRQAAATVEQKGEAMAMVQMRKHASWYTKGLPGAARMREKLVKIETLESLEAILAEWL